MNTNPSGPNQPLAYHPLRANQQILVGAGSNVVSNVVEGVDSEELLPMPPPGVIRAIGPENLFFVHNGSPNPVTVATVILKDSQGREYNFAPFGVAVPPGETVSLVQQLEGNVFLHGDDNPFVSCVARITGGAGGNIQIKSSWVDYRGLISNPAVEINFDGWTDISKPVPVGNAHLVATSRFVPLPSIVFWNFDDAPHNVFLRVIDADGNVSNVNDASLGLAGVGPAVGGVAARGSLVFGIGLVPQLVLAPGMRLQAMLAEAINSTGPVYAFMSQVPMNRSPVRPDQGGAY